MMKEPYDGWVSRMAERFQAHFSEISAEHNFDLGPEFEIALCHAFRRMLPTQYSVCRGFLVTRDGAKAGDDIIIFDAGRFPTLRSLGEDLTRKEDVPVEAAIAYVEAKHTLKVDSPESDGQSLRKAMAQVAAAQALPRAKVSTVASTPGFVSAPPTARGYPDFRNPLFTAIFARNISFVTPSDGVALVERLDESPVVPDLLVAGDTIATPVLRTGERCFVACPFRGFGAQPAVIHDVPNAMGLAVVQMLWALEHIQLGPFPWNEVFLSGLQGRLLTTRE